MLILLTDDDPVIRMGTAMILEELGHQVIEAKSGKEALGIIEVRGDIDALVTDYRMPGMSGLELIDIVEAGFPSVVTVLMSGMSKEEVGLDGRKTRFLAKPFGLKNIADVLIV